MAAPGPDHPFDLPPLSPEERAAADAEHSRSPWASNTEIDYLEGPEPGAGTFQFVNAQGEVDVAYTRLVEEGAQRIREGFTPVFIDTFDTASTEESRQAWGTYVGYTTAEGRKVHFDPPSIEPVRIGLEPALFEGLTEGARRASRVLGEHVTHWQEAILRACGVPGWVMGLERPTKRELAVQRRLATQMRRTERRAARRARRAR